VFLVTYWGIRLFALKQSAVVLHSTAFALKQFCHIPYYGVCLNKFPVIFHIRVFALKHCLVVFHILSNSSFVIITLDDNYAVVKASLSKAKTTMI
jgi:hypothetical protein